MRMSELADSVLLSRSGLTRLVDRLERDGLLERERCESDARGLFAEITPEGRELFDAARRTHLDGVRELFLGHFSRDELRALGALWQKLYRAPLFPRRHCRPAGRTGATGRPYLPAGRPTRGRFR